MCLKRYMGIGAVSFVLLSCLSACGPVKFSASSEDVTQTGTPTPTPTITPTPSPSATPILRDVHYNKVVTPDSYKLDIVLIVDDSNSMLPDNRKLAANLSGFISKLDNSYLDWQMCATVTRAIPLADGREAWGASIYWQKSTSYQAPSEIGWILKKGTPNLSTVFSSTIEYIGAGWQNSDDERGIKAAWRHAYNGDLHYNPNSGCYRSDSAVAYIIISDEDERSIGGDASQQVYQGELKPLEDEDKPDVFVSAFKSTFGADRRFTVNSIIVKPGDSTCKASQDSGTAKSHYGFKYAELSNMTGGGVGSICENDFSQNLNLFFDRIQDSLSSIPLECAPYNGNITVTITPSIGTVQSRIVGQTLVFDTPVPAGKTIDLRYQCVDRGPSSLGQATPATELGFFARIVNFFKNLF